MKELVFDIGGMHCASCAAAVERCIRALLGVLSADVNLPLNRMTVMFDERVVSEKEIIAAVVAEGFTAAPHKDTPVKKKWGLGGLSR